MPTLSEDGDGSFRVDGTSYQHSYYSSVSPLTSGDVATIPATCANCTNYSEVLFSQDRDGEGPWICDRCDYEVTINSDSDNWADEQSNPAMDHVESYDFDNDHDSPTPFLLLPELPLRTPRLISIEQEIGRGGTEVAARMYAAGHASQDHIIGYHSGESTNGFCHVEEDVSVNAEIVYGRMCLHQPEQARRLEGALGVTRQAIKDEVASLDMRCGTHVHVDAQGLGMEAVESLYHLWNHLEDTIYRIASANWSSHRSINGRNQYSPPTRKGIASRGDLGSVFENSRGALNLANYLASRSYCRCGSFAFSDWANCHCNLRKATVEFRVFNATANIRKVHAYTALSLALVEAARNMQFDPAIHPIHPWSETIEVIDAEKTNHALGVIFECLPLTDGEREDLRYCVDNSSLADY